jgi:hypothetical protein
MSETTNIAPNGVDLSKLSLKNVKFHEDMSEETGCFSGLLVDDGVVVAHVSNNGQGGCNNYHHYDVDNKAHKNLYERYGQLDVDCHIMGLAEDWNMASKEQSKKFVLKKGDNYLTSKTPKNQSFAQLKRMKGYQDWVKRQVRLLESEGYTVLNRNL